MRGSRAADLLSLFYSPFPDVDSVSYRHEVIADLEHPRVLATVRSFGQGMGRVPKPWPPCALSVTAGNNKDFLWTQSRRIAPQ